PPRNTVTSTVRSRSVRDRQQSSRGTRASEAGAVPDRARHADPGEVPAGARRRAVRPPPRPRVRQGFPPNLRGLPRPRRPAVRRRIQRPLCSRRGTTSGGAGQNPSPRAPAPPTVGRCPGGTRRGPARLGILTRRQPPPPSRGFGSADSTHARHHDDASTGSTHADAEAGPRGDRTRSHTRSMLAFGTPRLGHREAPVRADARTGPGSRLFRAAPLDPHWRALESRCNPERQARPVARLDWGRGRDAARRPSGWVKAPRVYRSRIALLRCPRMRTCSTRGWPTIRA